MAENLRINTKRCVISCVFVVNVAFLILVVIWSIQYFSREHRMVEKPIISNISQLDQLLERYLHDTKNLSLILDFDGVLAPLSDKPAETEIVPISQQHLRDLVSKRNVNVAVISGRGLEDVKKLVGLDQVTYGGNHGLEILYPNGSLYEHKISDDLRQNFTKLIKALEEHLAYNGAYVENKRMSLTFHYPKEPESDHQSIIEKAWQIVKYFGYVPTQGFCAIEAGPPIQWTKGEATDKLLIDQFGSNWQKYSKAIFVGDTDSDENAMKVLKGKGRSFRVSSDSLVHTEADFILPSIDTVPMLLQWILDRT